MRYTFIVVYPDRWVFYAILIQACLAWHDYGLYKPVWSWTIVHLGVVLFITRLRGIFYPAIQNNNGSGVGWSRLVLEGLECYKQRNKVENQRTRVYIQSQGTDKRFSCKPVLWILFVTLSVRVLHTCLIRSKDYRRIAVCYLFTVILFSRDCGLVINLMKLNFFLCPTSMIFLNCFMFFQYNFN